MRRGFSLLEFVVGLSVLVGIGLTFFNLSLLARNRAILEGLAQDAVSQLAQLSTRRAVAVTDPRTQEVLNSTREQAARLIPLLDSRCADGPNCFVIDGPIVTAAQNVRLTLNYQQPLLPLVAAIVHGPSSAITVAAEQRLPIALRPQTSLPIINSPTRQP